MPQIALPEASLSNVAIWLIAAAATALVIVRPGRWPEAIWAVLGAVLLLASGLLPWHDGLKAVGKGTDVYLFLVGMMLLSEVARREGLFDWLATHAVRAARGSAPRLFALIYAVGVAVTAFLSNDAAAVVMTPAVAAAVRAADAEPLPYLFVCAFIANAASFVLPISNPANLVLYAGHVPPLLQWLAHFALPSLAAVAATYVVLRLTERRGLARPIATEVPETPLGAGGAVAALGLVATGVVLLVVSAFDLPLGLPTALAGLATAALVLVRTRTAPWAMLRGISWAILPLVAGLFVLVAGIEHTGLLRSLTQLLAQRGQAAPVATAGEAGGLLALLCNLMNNLPAGLIAGSAVAQAHPPRLVTDALLVGVDLGPNLSVTGSLATILWLSALRREGLAVGFGAFLRRGALVMPPALLLALAALLVTR